MTTADQAIVVLLSRPNIRRAMYCAVAGLALAPFTIKAFLDGQLGLAFALALLGSTVAVGGLTWLWAEGRVAFAKEGGAP